jgi:hypothetical protein
MLRDGCTPTCGDELGWRLKGVFDIEIDSCARSGGKLRIIASIKEPQVIAEILSHLQCTAPEQYLHELPLVVRAPSVRSSGL